MTMIEIIAIIATGVLCVLCVICVAAMLSSQRQAKENKKAIKDIENSLGTFGDSIKEKTDQLIDRLERQQSDDLSERRLELLEEEIRQLSAYEEETAAGESADLSDSELWEIEEIDDEIEFDDLFRELESMPAEMQSEPAPPQQTAQQVPVMPQMQAAPQMQTAPQMQAMPQPQVQAAAPQQTAQQVQAIPQQQAAQPPAEPAEPAEARHETRYHQGYNIGRSGRKYTAEELNVLIRE